MAKGSRRVVLVSYADRELIGACEKALTEAGIESVEAYDCWSAEVAVQLSGAAAVVIDGHVVCDFVSPDRPGPILGLSPKLPVVVFNARELNDRHRSAVMAHNALMVDGEDVAEIARCVEGVLPPS